MSTARKVRSRGVVRYISAEQVQRVDAAVSEEVTRAFGAAAHGTNMHKLGLAMSLLQLLRTDALGEDRDQTLEDYDPEARGILGMRRSQLEKLVSVLGQEGDVKDALDRARTHGLARVFGSAWREALQQFANYILSDGFYQNLQGISDAARGERLKEELAKLAALDLELAQQTANEFMAQEIAKNPNRVIQNFSSAECTKAVDDVLCLIAGLQDDEGSRLGDLVGGTKRGTKVVGTGNKITALLRNSNTRKQIAQALGRAMTHRSYYRTIGDEKQAMALINELKSQGHDDAAAVVEKLRSGSAYARGFTAFSSLVALAGLVSTFPPVDSNGKVSWTALGTQASGTLAIAGSVPTVAKFFGEDMTPLIAKWLGRELQLSQKAVAGGATVSKLANAGKFAKICKFLGPIGDAIAVPVTVAAVFKEAKNEDDVGKWANIAGTAAGILGLTAGISALCASTGVGAPLAAVAAVIGLGAAAVDWFFSESALTGQIRQDLRYLGISTSEEQTYRSIAEERYTATAYTRAGAYQYTATRTRPKDEIRDRAKQADVYTKVRLINQYMDQATSGSEETLIFNILADTPYDGGQFLTLIEALDAKKLADELEYDGQNACVMEWIAKAYDKAGRPPGPQFDLFIKEMASQHREEPINKFLTDVDKALYQKIDPMVIKDCTAMLMDGHTGNGEERAIYELLNKTSYTQFNRIMEAGMTPYARRLKSELESWQWRNVRKWMTDGAPGKASVRVQHIALQVR